MDLITIKNFSYFIILCGICVIIAKIGFGNTEVAIAFAFLSAIVFVIFTIKLLKKKDFDA